MSDSNLNSLISRISYEDVINVKQQSLYARLKRLFATDVIVRNVGGKKLKIKDTDELMYATDRNSLRDRFNRVRSSGYNAYTRDFALSYQAARLDLFRDYDCVGPDTIIPLPDGTQPTIKELAEKYKDNPQERFLVFSYDHETDSIKLGKAYHPRKKQGKRQGYKVTFDDGSSIIGSLKHPFLMRDGSKKRLFELRVGDSVMPFYQKEYNCRYNKYKKIYNFSKGWQSEHVIVAEQCERPLNKDEIVHHKDFNGSNNSPENLQIMTKKDHVEFHSNHSKNVVWGDENYEHQLVKLKSHPNYINREFHHWNGTRRGENNPFHGKTHSDESNEKRSDTLKEIFKNRDQTGERNPKYRNDITFENVKQKAFEYYKEYSKINLWDFIKHIHCDHSTLQNRLQKEGYDWKSFKQEIESALNHKVISIECIGEVEVYDVTVEKYANFATDSCIVGNTMDMDPIISSALDIYADECLTEDEMGEILTIDSKNNNIKDILHNLFYDILNIEFNLWSWIRNMPVKYDSYIPLLNGENIRIDDLSKRVKSGEELWVYSVQDKTNKIVPGKVVWCDKNYTSNKIIKVIFNDDSSVETSPEHPFLLRDGNEKRADELKENDSLMPFYRKLSPEKGGMNKYEMIYTPFSDEYDFTHRIVAESCNIKTDEIDRILHHKNFNKYDNSPNNLVPMEFFEHRNLHAEHCKKTLHTPDIIEKRRKSLDKYLRSEERRVRLSKEMKGIKVKYFEEYNNSDLHSEHNKIRSELKKQMWLDPDKRKSASENMKKGWTTERRELASKKMKELRKEGILTNHKVKRIEFLTENSDVYCMTVLGPGGEHDRHNFAICGKDSDGNVVKNSGVFVKNCKYGDFYLKLNISPEYGVYLVEPMSAYNVERIENSDPLNKNYVKFQIRPVDTSQAEILESFQVAHFRLLSDSNFLPYGRSMIEPARRVWKQLSLLEDAMLIHRIMRAPEKRIFKIDIGNIPPNEVDNFMERTISKLKKIPYIDERTGDYNLRFNLQNMVEDFYLPVRGSDSGASIDTLPGMEFTGIDDLEYIKNKMMAALKIPKPFLTFEEGTSGKGTLTAEDVRFARTIGRLQKMVISELNRIAQVHLYAQGYRDASIVDFTIGLTNPSTVWEKEKMEIWAAKMENAKSMWEMSDGAGPFFARKFVYKKIFKMSDDDIQKNEQDIVEDCKQLWRLKQIAEEGNDPAKPFKKINPNAGEGGGEGEPGGLPGGPSGGPDLGGEEGGPEAGGEPSGSEAGGESEPGPVKENIKNSLKAAIKDAVKKEMVQSRKMANWEWDTKNEETLDEKHGETRWDYKRPSQVGEKDANDYPRGEDPLGSLENKRQSKADMELKPRTRKDPLALETTTVKNLNSFLSSIKQEKKELVKESTGRSLMDETNILE